MANNKQAIFYAGIIVNCLGQMFDDESDFQIDKDELMDGENLTQFFHALANIAPTHFFNTFTGADKNNLEFNHIANQLVFQYSQPEPDNQ